MDVILLLKEDHGAGGGPSGAAGGRDPVRGQTCKEVFAQLKTELSAHAGGKTALRRSGS